jgi:hypothetical protein
MIREAYTKAQPIENNNLNSACQKFLKAYDNLPEVNIEIKTVIENNQLTNIAKEEEISVEKQLVLENC